LLTWRPDPVDLRRLPCTLFSPLDYVLSLLIIYINLVTRPNVTNGISVLRGWRTAHAVFYKLKPRFWNPNQQLTGDLGQKLHWLLIFVNLRKIQLKIIDFFFFFKYFYFYFL
jgi:hypothetical protein